MRIGILIGATYYVGPNGNDAYTPVQAQQTDTPWKTIQKAAAIITAGDSLIIKEGTYYETDIEFSHSGTENNWIVITAEPNGHPILTGSGKNGIVIIGDKNIPYSKSHFIIDGLTITGCQDDGITVFYADYIVMNNIHAYGNGNAGINVVDSDHILVQDSELHHNGWNSEGDSGWGDGLSINNHKAVGRTSIIRRNLLYANFQKRPGSYWDGNGFTLDMAGDQGMHIVANNMFFNNGGAGLLAGDTGTLFLVHNIFFRNMSDPRCRNYADLYLVQTGVHDSKMKNNIIYSRPDIWTIDRYTGNDDALIENNLIWGQDESDTKIWWLDWKAVTMDYWILNRAPSTLHGDPGFISAPYDKGFISFHNSEWIDMNIEDYNFRLASYSQCIDQGGFLTATVSGGSGNRITVETAHYFTDGFGIEGQGDVIKVGTNAPVTITEIDYDQNILVVNRSISWNRGDYVSFPYNGIAPDIGAFEYGEFIEEVGKDNHLYATIGLGKISMLGRKKIEFIMKTSQKVIRVPSPAILVMNDGSEIFVYFEGSVPGDYFTGTLEITDTLSEGPAQFRLQEGSLVGINGQMNNPIYQDDVISIDLTPPQQPSKFDIK